MVRDIDYQAIEPVPKFNKMRSNTIPHSPRKLILATIDITIPTTHAYENHVKLTAKVGVQGVSGTSKILFKFYRDGVEIYTTEKIVEPDPASDKNYIAKIQCIDRNVRDGSHTYKVTAENITSDSEASVVGPITFNGLAREGDRSRNKDRRRDHDREIVKELDSELDRLVRFLDKL